MNPDMLDAGMTPESATTPDGQIVMGLLMLQGFEKSAKDWRSGTIFDPGEGKTYSSRLKRLEDGRLQVQGCIAWRTLTLTYVTKHKFKRPSTARLSVLVPYIFATTMPGLAVPARP